MNNIVDYRIEYGDSFSTFTMTVVLLGYYSILKQDDVEALQDIVIYLDGNLKEISNREFLKFIKSFVATEEKTELWVQLWN